MIIRDIEGALLYEDAQKTIRKTLESAISKGVGLPKANLRRARLKYALLDGLQADGACFWGADFTGADIAEASLKGADLRNSCLDDVCFAATALTRVDFRGAFFRRTILEQANMGEALFSGESFFSCDLVGIKGLEQSSYVCEDGHKIDFMRKPIVVNGLSKRLVMMGGHILWGSELYGPQGKNGRIPTEVMNFVSQFVPTTQKNLSLSDATAKGGLSGF